MDCFLPDDRALCIRPRIGLRKGALYHVWACSAPTADGSQVLFLSERDLVNGDGASSSRFRRVRPASNVGPAREFLEGYGDE